MTIVGLFTDVAFSLAIPSPRLIAAHKFLLGMLLCDPSCFLYVLYMDLILSLLCFVHHISFVHFTCL